MDQTAVFIELRLQSAKSSQDAGRNSRASRMDITDGIMLAIAVRVLRNRCDQIFSKFIHRLRNIHAELVEPVFAYF